MRPIAMTSRPRSLDRHAAIRQRVAYGRWQGRGLLACLGMAALLSMAPTASAEPVSAIGRLNFAGFRDRMHCTATLIAPDRVLTAAHCLPQRARPENIHFLPDFAPAGWLEDLTLANWTAAPGKRDVALLCLAGSAQTAPLPRSAAGPVVGEALTVIGYPIPRRYAQSHIDCTVERVDGAGGGFTLSCPLRPGASGAPVLRRTTAGSEIVGVVSATNATRSLAFDVSGKRALPPCE